MAENQGAGRVRSVRKQLSRSGIPADLALLTLLGVVSFVLFRFAGALTPGEGAALVVATAGLSRAAIHWWDWQRTLAMDGSIADRVQRILQGEREPWVVPEGLRDRDRPVAAALNAVVEDYETARSEVAELRRALGRDWRDLDALMEAVQRQHQVEVELRSRGSARLAALGRDLKEAIESTLRLDQIELNYRLRADQSRLQGQAFRSTLEQLQGGLDQFENLLDELQDTFPRLRREEDAMRRLADAGLRQGARLNLAVKGLVAHTPRLVDDTQARTECLRRLRQTADGVRDQTEALARRLEGFREEAQTRIRSFGGAQGSLKELDHVAQQTGLLAVNAAILAQQDSGGAGLAAIGGRLRQLADQTAGGASGMERMLDEYQQGLERETAGLWDLQEVAQRLLSEVHELLRTADHMDHQGRDLELALDNHLGKVDAVRQTAERAELSLHEVSARAMALESAHGRQWSVEAKITPEQDRISRVRLHLAEVGEGLARVSQQNIDELWNILARHQEIRRTPAYQQVTSENLPHLMEAPGDADSVWNPLAWARAQRHPRLVEYSESLLVPLGRHHADGGLRLRLLGQNALQLPEASALESWACDPSGRAWDFHLLASLSTESHRLALLAVLKESPLTACFQGLDMRIAPKGVHIRLPHPFPGLPAFLAGLELELPVEPELWGHAYREIRPPTPRIQPFIWIGPGQGGGPRNPCLRLAHAWVRDGHDHECFLPGLPFPGHRQTCPWLGDHPDSLRLPEPVPVRCIGFGVEPSLMHPVRDRFLQAGATEGPGGLAICAARVGHPHPEALLLSLFQPEAELAGAFHPDLVPFQIRLRDEVLAGSTGDPYHAAWSILEDLQRAGWLMPLPLP